MLLQDSFLFFIILLAMLFFAHAEAYQEGKNGWKWNTKWWRIPLPHGYWYTAYHIFMYFLTFPLLIFGIPFAIVGWNNHLMKVLLFSYLLGSILEDFTWFVVNRDYSFKNWNPKDTRWYPWITIGNFSLPLSYCAKFLFCLLLLFFIFKDYQSL